MPAKPKPDLRRRELAAIHAAKRELRLDDDTYRDMLWTVARVRSAADLDAGGRRAVLDHLRSRGWAGRRRPRPRVAPDRQALHRKINAQLDALQRPRSYADALARRICKVERLEWCTPAQLGRIVAALDYQQRREGAPRA